MTGQTQLITPTLQERVSRLGPRQRLVYRALETRGSLSAAEAGGLIHDERGRHNARHHCPFCGTEGKDVLRSLRRLELAKYRRKHGYWTLFNESGRGEAVVTTTPGGYPVAVEGRSTLPASPGPDTAFDPANGKIPF